MGLHDHPSGLPPGYEFGYDQITANVTISGTAEASSTAVINCAAHYFDGGPVMVEFYCGSIQIVPTAQVLVNLFEGAAEILRLAQMNLPGSDVTCTTLNRFTPSAGMHTYTLSAWRTGADCTIRAGAGGSVVYAPCFVRFVKV